ncbi:hypothetical protein GCM10010399_64340 [Dactylosporangium fulvum]
MDETGPAIRKECHRRWHTHLPPLVRGGRSMHVTASDQHGEAAAPVLADERVRKVDPGSSRRGSRMSGQAP